MLPGVVATISRTTFGADSISVAGQNIRNVNYTMDGSNNNDTFNGGNGGAQARVPVEAVQEFQLLTSQFDAEYGLASGGIVNSVSKQGTNTYHGSAFLFYQDENLAANEYFARRDGLEKAQTKQQQLTQTLNESPTRTGADQRAVRILGTGTGVLSISYSAIGGNRVSEGRVEPGQRCT